jgi:3-oxoacyl-[acyl-carrier protein] reductase
MLRSALSAWSDRCSDAGGERTLNRLEGKVALITGGGSGLGSAIARRFTEEGASVIVNDIRADAAERVAGELKGHAVIFDVADSSAVAAGFKEVRERYDRLDILVNNAGIGLDITEDERVTRERLTLQQVAEMQAGGPVDTFVDVTMHLSDERWRRMLAIHLDGTFYCTREALQIMAPQMSGAIVNMGSIMGSAGGAGSPHYCAAKAGIMGLTRSLARELVVRNIRVNAIAPGYIDTPMTEPLGALRPLIEAQTPMRRLGEPDDIAWAAVYLASDEAKFVTGQVLSPNGGWVMNQ